MADDDNQGSSSGKRKSSKAHRSGGEVGDDEPPLEGYSRYVAVEYRKKKKWWLREAFML